MSSVAVAAVQNDDFAGSAYYDGAVITTSLRGTADFAAISAVETLLERTHAEATRQRAELVIVDLKQLEFMNSTCFKAFVAWITEVEEATAPYKIKFVANPGLLWQKRSLISLHALAPGIAIADE